MLPAAGRDLEALILHTASGCHDGSTNHSWSSPLRGMWRSAGAWNLPHRHWTTC